MPGFAPSHQRWSQGFFSSQHVHGRPALSSLFIPGTLETTGLGYVTCPHKVYNTTFLPEENIYLWFTLLVSLLSAIGIITLYMAIQRGPISVVIPIFSLSAVITAILGILILEETVTVEKITGLVLAIAAIILLTRD